MERVCIISLALLPLIVLWANCHGSFLIGIALPLFFLGGGLADDFLARRRGNEVTNRMRHFFAPLALTSLAMAAAALINPFGWSLFTHVVDLSGSEFIIDDRIDAYGEDYYREYQRYDAFNPGLLASAEEFVEYFDRRRLNLIVLDIRPMNTWYQTGRLKTLDEAGWKPV
jgi:hypothetical protein